MDRESFVAKIQLFAALDADELRDILLLARPFSFPAHHRVFDQGALADGMYVLEQGHVQLWARLLGEEEIALAQIGPGGVLGEFSLIDHGPRSAAAEVIEPAEGYFFSNRQFDLLRADRRPATLKTMQQLCAILCQRLRGAAGRLSDSPPTFYSHTQRASVPPALERPTPAAEVDGDRLRGLPFFSSFTPSELKDLLAPLSVRTLRRGRVLYSEGDEPASAFVCIRGAVEVAAGPRTAGHRVAVVGPGRLFGLVAPLDGGLRHTSAVIRENAIVLEIPCSEVRALLGADTAVAFKFSDAVLYTLIASLRSANRTLLCQAAMGRVSQRKKRAPSLLPL